MTFYWGILFHHAQFVMYLIQNVSELLFDILDHFNHGCFGVFLEVFGDVHFADSCRETVGCGSDALLPPRSVGCLPCDVSGILLNDLPSRLLNNFFCSFVHQVEKSPPFPLLNLRS